MLDWQVIASGLEFPEGPIAMPDGSVLLVEMHRQTLSRVASDGRVEVVAHLGGGPNGAAIGPDGRCYVCNNGGLTFTETAGALVPNLVPENYSGGWIEAVDLSSGHREILYRQCRGVSLFGPNDIVFDSHGGFYFTDSGKVRAHDRDRGSVCYASIDGRSIKRVVFPLEGANGIGLSPDGNTLYVAESTTGRLWAYEISAPGQISRTKSKIPWLRGRMLLAMPHYSIPDSLGIEANGNICLADIPSGGITVISPDGAILEQHATPDAFTTNICFGGDGLTLAYVTLSSSGRLASATWPRPGLRLHWPN